MRKGMHNLRRNTTVFEYLPPGGVTSDLNDNGEHTGEFYQVHKDPVEYRGTITMPGGYVSTEFFGTDERYTHVLILDDPEADIDKLGMIRWKGKMYEIRAVRPSINTLNIALREKTMNNVEPDPTGETGVTGSTGQADGESV